MLMPQASQHGFRKVDRCLRFSPKHGACCIDPVRIKRSDKADGLLFARHYTGEYKIVRMRPPDQGSSDLEALCPRAMTIFSKQKLQSAARRIAATLLSTRCAKECWIRLWRILFQPAIRHPAFPTRLQTIHPRRNTIESASLHG